MSLKATWYRDKLLKKFRRGFHGYPVATVAYYGPDDRLASKAVVGIAPDENAEVEMLERWYAETGDIRQDPAISEAIVRYIESHAVRSVLTPGRIIGCPHEAGVHYPEGGTCPVCTYWAGRDRFTGERLDGEKENDA
ncbi:hypothetical protein [Plasticicumulans sp.]|uniref:hypothetical protein n=1 Tax=Plasticicumulans sp. TaxID=2307179 RepID=UPI0032201EC0